jgi:hypothetical protein
MTAPEVPPEHAEVRQALGMDVTVAPAVTPTGDRPADAVHSTMTAPPAKRRAVWYAIAVAVAVAIAAIVIVAVHKPPPVAPVIAVTAASANNLVAGNVYVYYKVAGLATATITATVSRGIKGEVAELTGQIYPFTTKPTVLRSVPITGRYQRLSFSVKPSLETRYRVEVLRSAGAPKTLAISPVSTVYVALIARYEYTRNKCPRPNCFVTIAFRVPVAHAALQTELAKHVYFYWGINLATSGPEPPDPTKLDLQKLTTDPATPGRSGGEYLMILAFKFTVNQDAYRWHWNICTKASLSVDGVGLPGPGQCGRDTIAGSTPGYLGSLAG